MDLTSLLCASTIFVPLWIISTHFCLRLIKCDNSNTRKYFAT